MTKQEKFCAFWATGFGVGFWPWGPGTAGALLATLMWLVCSVLVSASSLFWITIVAVVVATLIGTITTSRLERVWGDDPKQVVIDEMLGVWLPLAFCPSDFSSYPSHFWYVAAALALFRFFDIVKPLGIRALDRRHGGFWVMADDILAGVYSLIIILILRWLFQ